MSTVFLQSKIFQFTIIPHGHISAPTKLAYNKQYVRSESLTAEAYEQMATFWPSILARSQKESSIIPWNESC